jgi:endonuclease IV
MNEGLIGFHCGRDYMKKKGATIEQHIEAAKKKLAIPNLKIVQIFMGPPRNFQVSITEAGEKSLLEYIKKTGMTIIAHCRYFCVPFSSEVKPAINHFMQREWKLAKRCGIKGVVIHLYRFPRELVTERLVKLELDPDVKIILETPAISPDKAIYSTPKALCELYQMTKKAGLNVGICVDTCHLYVSGVDLANESVMNQFMSELTKYIPAEDLLIHLNDSAAMLGSGRDKHASLGQGYIWGQDMGSLKILLDYIERYKIETINERNEGNGTLAEDYRVIRSLS